MLQSIDKDTFDENFYLSMLRTSHNVGMEVIPLDVGARLMAITYVFDAEEVITHCPKLKCDLKYLQEVYHIGGGETPDWEFVRAFQKYAKPLEEAYHKDNVPSWVNELMMKRYGFKL